MPARLNEQAVICFANLVLLLPGFCLCFGGIKFVLWESSVAECEFCTLPEPNQSKQYPHARAKPRQLLLCIPSLLTSHRQVSLLSLPVWFFFPLFWSLFLLKTLLGGTPKDLPKMWGIIKYKQITLEVACSPLSLVNLLQWWLQTFRLSHSPMSALVKCLRCGCVLSFSFSATFSQSALMSQLFFSPPASLVELFLVALLSFPGYF